MQAPSRWTGAVDDRTIDRGSPGGSLLRTYEHRRAAREHRVRQRFPRIGGVMLAFSSEPASTANFSRGAEAEIRVARYLTRRCGSDVELLFSRDQRSPWHVRPGTSTPGRPS